MPRLWSEHFSTGPEEHYVRMNKGKQPILYALSSGVSFLLDTGLFYLLNLLFGGLLGKAAVPVTYLGARAVSSFFNFNVNRSLVFHDNQQYGRALLRYYGLAVTAALVGAGLTTLMTWLFGAQEATSKTLVKIPVECFLFVANFFVQKLWVFRKTDPEDEIHTETCANDSENKAS